MDALRNTLREWSLTASPCSNVAADSLDVWSPPRPSDDDGAHGGYMPLERCGTASWHARRRANNQHNHHHHSNAALNNNNSFCRSAAFSSSYRSLHDGDTEDFGERQHLRAALHSAVAGSPPSSRASMDLHSSGSSLEDHHYDDDDDRGLGAEEDDEDERGLVSDDADSTSSTHILTMLPAHSNDADELGMLTPLEQRRSTTWPKFSTRSLIAGGSTSEKAVQSPAHSSAAAAAPPAAHPRPAQPNRSGNNGATTHGDGPMSPLRLSMTLLQARRAEQTGGAAVAANPGSLHPLPPRPTPLSSKPSHTPLLDSAASSKSFRVRSSSSVGSGYLEEEEGEEHSRRAPHTTSTLLRPSFLLEPLPVAAAAAADDAPAFNASSSAEKDEVEGEPQQPIRRLVPLLDVIAANLDSDDVCNIADLPLHLLDKDLDFPTAPVAPHPSMAHTGREEPMPARSTDKFAHERAARSTTQGLSISTAVAANLSQRAPSTNAHDVAAAPPSITVTADPSVSTLHVQTTAAPTSPAVLLRPAPAATSALPSHLTTPAVPHKNVSPLLCRTAHSPDDHAAAHVLPQCANAAAATSAPAAAPATAEAADVVRATPTPTAIPAVAVDGAAVETELSASVLSKSTSSRRPLLIPQPHRRVTDVTGRTVLLRAHKHLGAVSSQVVQSASYSHAPLCSSSSISGGQPHLNAHPFASSRRSQAYYYADSLSAASDTGDRVYGSMGGVGLCSVPQPYGAYPYQWMVTTETGAGQSSDSSFSAAALRRRASSLAVSHPSSYGTVSTATPAALTSLQRSVSDGQLFTSSGRPPPQGCC